MSDGPLALLRLTAMQMTIDLYEKANGFENSVDIESFLQDVEEVYKYLVKDLEEADKKKDATVSPLRPV